MDCRRVASWLATLGLVGGCEGFVEGVSGTDGTTTASMTTEAETSSAQTEGGSGSTGSTGTTNPSTSSSTSSTTTDESTTSTTSGSTTAGETTNPSTSSETTESETTSTGNPGVCGDGMVDDDEECDDGMDNSDVDVDACRTNCRFASCGDGVLDSPEACDDGGRNSDSQPNACRTNCQPASCGDGVMDMGEACDDGAANSDSLADACRQNCEVAGCGDDVIDTGEACDDGDANSDLAADACRTTCESAGCGDGVQDTAELCDDDNAADNDGCSAVCDIELGFECGSTPSVCGPASILVNGDFEDSSAGDPFVGGSTFPFVFPGTAVWFGDLADFVPAENGITPLDGVAMLHHQATNTGAGTFIVCNVDQVVDMAPYLGLIADGRVTLEASASFNRVDNAIDSQFRVRIAAFSGSEAEGWTQLDANLTPLFADLDEGTWEEATATLALPVATTFVSVSVDAVENNQEDDGAPEFLGHYVDAADLRITVAPPP